MIRGISDYTSGQNSRTVMLAIGPEGGFIEAEVASLRDSLGFHGVGLGNRILKVEVALHLLHGSVVDAMEITQDQKENGSAIRINWGKIYFRGVGS